MQDFNMEFDRLTTGEIIAQANDPNLLSHMDRDDLLNLVQNLSDRLEEAYRIVMENRNESVANHMRDFRRA